jgi:hypothetical protein
MTARLLPLVVVALFASRADATQTHLAGPSGSTAFGTQVVALPNGNFVVTDPDFSLPNLARIGAVHLYSAAGERIRALTGSQTDDRVGSGGVRVLTNGNFVVVSPRWRNGAIAEAGAVTWVDGDTGLGDEVSPSNSLVGSSADDAVGAFGVRALSTGHYVVVSRNWSNGHAARAGAVTWGNGNGGTTGPISSSNSLIGTQTDDQIGNEGIVPLTNGNYVVVSTQWHRGSIEHAGAVTWCSGGEDCGGEVHPDNSLVGSSDGDSVGAQLNGSSGVVPLHNGHYAVASARWSDGPLAEVGAATWCDGTFGCSGEISSTNSLTGSSADDHVGGDGITPLSNGHYVVSSPRFDGGALVDAGAATWGNGNGGTVGPILSTNSLLGSTINDQVGSDGVTALSNGNYVVASSSWGVGNGGAATWVDGSAARSGLVTIGNSLVGSNSGDFIAMRVTALSNGHYVLAVSQWDNGATPSVGAVLWAHGGMATGGFVNPSVALIGSTASDRVGSGGVAALANGHYVVASPEWNSSTAGDVGAATWRNGNATSPGVVSAANSMIGTSTGDRVSAGGVIALSDGRYVIGSPEWSTPGAASVGAVTALTGNLSGLGTVGNVSESNSLVGSSAQDQLGAEMTIHRLPDATYVVRAPEWNTNLLRPDTGAIAWPRHALRPTGEIAVDNAVVGGSNGGGALMRWSYDPVHDRLIVGRPADNLVTLFDTALFRNGFE